MHQNFTNTTKQKTGGALLHIITGPPAAGKSTYLKQHAKPGDIRIDFDDLANLLTGKDPANHEHDRDIRDLVRAMRTTAIKKAMQQTRRDVWIIHSNPAENTMSKYKQAGATIHTIDPGKDIVMKRIKQQRPPVMLKVAGQWYDRGKQTPKPKGKAKSATAKGLGYKHQQQRANLLRRHIDGTPCWWCGKPMYKEPIRNFDKKALHADHINPRAKAGITNNPPDRLMHHTCNSQRGDGSRDHERPAGVVQGFAWSNTLPPKNI